MTYISARIQDSNEIPTATPIFPGSDNRYRLQGKSSNKDGGHYPEVLTDTQLNSVNIGLAVEMLLLTYIRAEL